MRMLKMLLALAFQTEGGGGNDGKTPEQIAADQAAADKATADAAAATARAEAEKSWKPEQIAAAEAAAKAAKDAGKTAAEIATAREEAARTAAASETGPTAPAKYELKWPESSSATAEDVKAFEGWARKLNLTNVQAQAMLEEREAQVDSTLARFKEETAANADYGGEKLAETQKLANLIIDKVRPEGHARREALLAILEGSGYINNIEIVSFLADLGRLAGEDGTGMGGGGGQKEVNMGDQLFPSTAVKS